LRTGRGYFRNWFSTYLRYFLYRVGFLKVRVLPINAAISGENGITEITYRVLL